MDKKTRMMRAAIGAGALGVMATALALPARADDDIWHRDTLTGDWGGLRTDLHDRGLDLTLNYIGEGLGDLSGGKKRGFVYEGRGEASVDADLEKLLGWTGGLFHATGYRIDRTAGGIGANFTGSLSDPSNIEARPATRLFTVWLQQSLLDDALSVRAGQLAADDEFFVSPTASGLVNATFGWPDILSATLPGGGPAYPLATPGVRLQVNPAPNLSFLAAVFSGNPAGRGCAGDAQACDNHGTTFSLSGGTFWIAEAQYRVNHGEHAAGLPGVYKLGAWYHDARFADQRYGLDAAGARVPLASSASIAAVNHRGDQGIYAVADQTLWRDGEKGPSLNGFLRVGAAPADRNLISLYVDGGLGYTGLIPGRAQDTLTLGAAYAKISGDAADRDRDAALFGTPGFPVRDQETLIEVSYRAQVTPWFTVQPDLQYIMHPGGFVPDPDASTSAPVKDALVAGVRATIAF